MNTTSDKLNYLAETKTAIKDAIVAKGVAVAESDTFRSYAGKIGEIQSGGNEFSEIGYESTPQYILDGIEYAKKIQQEWDNPTSLQNRFFNNKRILFFPNVDCSNATVLTSMFNNSSIQYVDNLAIPNATSMAYAFQMSQLRSVRKILSSSKLNNLQNCFFNISLITRINEFDTSGVSGFSQAFQNDTELRYIGGLDFSSITNMSSSFKQCTSLSFLKIRNFGKSSLDSYDFSQIIKWGDDTNTWEDGTLVEGSRQSLVDSLITYSFDRASAGMPACTITLHQDVKERLTEEEKAQITAKGFTIA